VGVVGTALVGSVLLTFVARPVSVWVSAVVQPLTRREIAFVSWAGLRGAVPIVLATIPFAEGVTDSERLFDVVFVIVVISTVLTGPTLPWVARRLDVTRHLEPRQLDLEVAPLERLGADMLQVTISPVSRLHGVEVGELRLPEGSSVSMVVRDGHAIVPEGRTVLRRGDDVLVVTPRGLREPTVRRLRVVSAHGRLGRWLGD
jgi:cell volume regulation protein A